MNDSRYQFQPWRVRTYRWWRHMPLAYVRAVLAMIAAIPHLPEIWRFSRSRVEEIRREEDCRVRFGHVWGYFWSMAWLPWHLVIGRVQCEKMNWSYTLEEAFSQPAKKN